MPHRAGDLTPGAGGRPRGFFDKLNEWARAEGAGGLGYIVFDAEGPVAYMPVQRPLVLDSLAPRPGLTRGQTAGALKEIFQFAVTKAHENGVGEILFFATDEATAEFAERQQVFHRVPYAVYRVKVAELEKQGA